MDRIQMRAWLLIVLVAAAGCGFRFTAPPVRYFEVRPTSVESQAGAKLPSLMVPDFSCLSAYDHLRLVVRKSPVELESSRNFQWTTVPGRMLAQGLRARLEATERFETIRREASPLPPYIVEGLVQVIELAETPRMTAHLALHINLRRSHDASVILEEFLEDEAPAAQDTPADGVWALRDLYSLMLDRLTARIIDAIEQDLRTEPK